MRGRLKRALPALAGPAVIVASVLIVLNGFAFRGLITTDDVESFFLPTYCLLGRSLAAGHIPAWNPFAMGGVPFAADPQSGWLYLPAMVLFGVLSCGAAIRWMIVLQPILAGLGVSWFLRAEDASRPAAVTGGVAIAVAIAGAELALSLPFAGTLAWTALLLAAGARLLRARTWPARSGWLLATAGAWGQLASAHMSVGLLMGTAVFAAYAATRAVLDVRAGRATVRREVILAGLTVASMLAVNLALLLPRIGYLPRTNLSMGYGELQSLGAALSGRPMEPFEIGGASGPGWVPGLATSPGAHLGAVALGLAFAGLWSKRYRALTTSLLITAAGFFVLSLQAVASHVPPSVRGIRLVDAYLHRPEWFAFPVLLILAVLAGFGLEAWREHRSARSRALMVAPAIVMWGVLPLVAGAGWHRLSVLAGGAVLGAVVLLLGIRRAAILALVPGVLAIELIANGLQGYAPEAIGGAPRLFRFLPEPVVPTDRLTTPGPFARALEGSTGGRYVQVGELTVRERRRPTDHLPNFGMLFAIPDIGAYNPVQLLRFWEFVRAVNRVDINYNAANFRHPAPVVLDLLQVGFVMTPAGRPREPGSTVLATEGRWVLLSRPHPAPRAEFVGAWRVVPGPAAAMNAIRAPGFDPSARVVLEQAPGLASGAGGAGRATARTTYRDAGPQHAVIQVDAPGPGVVLVRNAFEPNWRAAVDGRPVPVLAADFVIQGIPVGGGRHVIELFYDDPLIGYGMLGSAVAIVTLLGAAGAGALRDRRRRRPDGVDGEPG